MELQHYAFALFIAGLMCLIAVLCKVLFSDLRRQHKMLDEKETKLLQLYQTVESIMEEFADQAKAATDEIREYENRISRRAPPVAQVQAQEPVAKEQAEKPQRSLTVDSSRIRAASEVLERAERIIKSDVLKPPAAAPGAAGGTVFQSFFDETASEPAEPAKEANDKHSRRESILALSAEGKTEAQIASELGITRNEVRLVIELG